MLRFVIFLIAVHATVLIGLTGVLRDRYWASRIVPVLLGLTMIAIGNLLPRTRPNLAIGIRTSGTLADRTQWMHTHRIAGYAVVVLGVVILVAALAVPPPMGPAMILVAGPPRRSASPCSCSGSRGTPMESVPELKLLVEEKRGAIDVYTAWLPRLAVVFGFLIIGASKFSGGRGEWFESSS